MKSVAYIITCTTTGKQYVGITLTTAAIRWKAHLLRATRGKGSALGSAIRKYGPETFELRVLVQASREYLAQLEPLLIVLFGTKAPGGYNITSGGDQCDANKGRKLSPEWRRKLSEAHRRHHAQRTAEERSEIGKKSWANSDSERNRRQSERTKELHADPVWRADWLRKLRAGKVRQLAGS